MGATQASIVVTLPQENLGKQAHGVSGMEWSANRRSGTKRNGDRHDGASKKCEWQESKHS